MAFPREWNLSLLRLRTGRLANLISGTKLILLLTIAGMVPASTALAQTGSQGAEAANVGERGAAESGDLPFAEHHKSSQQKLILVTGASGAEEYESIFSAWAERWEQAAKGAGMECLRIGKSSEEAGEEELSDDVPSDANRLRDALISESSVATQEPVWLVFIGHGTYDGRTASWNLRGPDVTAEMLAESCRNFQRPLAVIACASCSAPFINALSGPDRVIVTATKDGNQIQYSRFGDAMSQAIGTLEADIDRDGQTSLLEAWLFASRRTAEYYKTEGRLATEHALLDDNGDAMGIRSELYDGDQITVAGPQENIDGAIASRWVLVRSQQEQLLSAEQRETRDALEGELEQLRRRRNTMDEQEYLNQLEAILLPLARLYEEATQSGKH